MEREGPQRDPALVTWVDHNCERKRVKLVFFHHHFVNERQLEKMKDPTVATTTLGNVEIVNAERLPDYVLSVMCPGGTIRLEPRGITVAKLIEWPPLTEQGDGSAPRPLNSGNLIVAGYAVCSGLDNYERAIGRHLALKDLLKNAAIGRILPGESIQAVAKCYTNRVARKRAKPAKPLRTPVPKVIEHLDPGDEISAT